MKKKLIRVTTVPLSLSGLLNGQLNFMSKTFDVMAISSNGKDGDLEKVGVAEGVKTIPVEMTRKITPLKDLQAVYKLYKIFKREQPFIVHSHTPKAGTLSMMAAKLAGVPHRLHTIAGLPLLEASGAKRTLLNLVEKLTYACATKIYPNSKGQHQIILEEKFTKANKLKVIANGSSNGIDITRFNPELFDDSQLQALRKTLNIKASDFVFVFVGRLVSDKGINELLKAFNTLSSQTKIPVKLLLVGDYETELDPLKAETLEIKETNPNIVSTGWVQDVRPYFAISDCLTFPSYREGFPNVVMQAGAMGIPSIVTNINGCNEIIIEGQNGTIIPVKNASALQDKMEQVLKGELKYNNSACRDLIVNRYQRQVIWDGLLQEYLQLN